MYNTQLDYQRFNQRYNVLRQAMWHPEMIELTQRRAEKTRQMVLDHRPGYSLLDWGFFIGAYGNMANTGFHLNAPNQRGNYWLPLYQRGEPQRGLPRLVSRERWEGGPKDATTALSMMARKFGADVVGFCKLDRRWVYSHYFDEETNQDFQIKFSDEAGYEGYQEPTQQEDGIQVIPKEMEYVVVMLHEMDEEGIATAPTLTQFASTIETYSRISYTTVMLAEFIRGLGYNAIPSANDTALNIPLAIDAGLGQLGRNAKLISPWFGPRCRVSKVITDLPVVTGKPVDYGVTQFCQACQKCAKKCPPGAIPLGERSLEPMNECNNYGVLQWQLEHKKCYAYWSEVATNCGICIRTCPFNKPKHKIHDATRWFIKNFSQVNPLIVRLDDVMGYGKFKSSDSFWRV
jgi:reductive dehalogenase